jgi:hypothetical protein
VPVLLAAASLLFCPPARSSVIVNGFPSLTGGGTLLQPDVAAEFFTLSSAMTLQSVEFAVYGNPSLWDGTLDYYFFDNSGFYPASSPFAQGHDPAYSITYLINGGTHTTSFWLFDFDLNTPVTMGPGTYWLGLHMQNGYAFGAGVVWDGTTTPNAQPSAESNDGTFDNWVLTAGQLYLSVTGTDATVPEPAPVLFAGLGLAGLAAWRLRTRRR